MIAREGSNGRNDADRWMPAPTREAIPPPPAPPVPDLGELERSVGHLGSDWLGLARVMIGCTRALLVALHRIERRLER